MVVEGTTVKAVAGVAGAGLLATITRDPDFWVLFVSAILISSASYTFDIHKTPLAGRYLVHFTTWLKYVTAGLATMFFSFYALVSYTPDEYQLQTTVWYFISVALAGYGVPILDQVKGFVTPLLGKVFK